MKRAARLGYILGGMVLMVTASPSFAAPEFCWKDSYGRGVGTVPASCAPGQEMIGVLCYNVCGAGMKRYGFDCHSVCPSDMADQGLFCRRAEYGRGGGYPWKFGDALNNSGMMARCENDKGRGNCEMWGAIAYPKCAAGYSPFGCCICRPGVPDCGKLGLNPGIDLSCAKKVVIGSPQLGTCASNQERDAGLCYQSCGAGNNGVGPVCWGKPPSGWVDCGMGAAKDSFTCGTIVFGQVASVGQLALTVATLGSSMAATGPASAAANAGKLAQLKAQMEQLKTAYEAAKTAYPALKTAEQVGNVGLTLKRGYNAISTSANIVTVEDIARAAAQIAAIAETSGVASTVGAYTYAKCSKYFPSAPK